MNVLLLLILCLYQFVIFANTSHDLKKIKKITDAKSCYATLSSLLQENVNSSEDKNEPHFVKFEELSPLLLTIDGNYEKFAWTLYPTFVKAYCKLKHLCPAKDNAQFNKLGYVQGIVNDRLNKTLLLSFNQVKTIPFLYADFDPNYLATPLDIETEDVLNNNHRYVMLEEEQLNALKPIIASLKQPISECLGSPWRILTIRSWYSYPYSANLGPNNWHHDAFPLNALKIMFYPKGADKIKGSTELKIGEGTHVVEGPAGSWLLFKNSEIIHRGIQPQDGERLVIEITIAPSIEYDLTPICAGQNARHPLYPWQGKTNDKYPLYYGKQILGINIGGGTHWHCPSWINLEEVISSTNLHSFKLYPNCQFPFSNNSVKNVYTSHAIEHLNLPTVKRVLSESFRVLEQEGNLIIKIPDYDEALTAWRCQLPFFGPIWNIESVTHLWESKNITDNVDNRALMVFASFYTPAYDNPFGFSINSSSAQAYFGPPKVDACLMEKLKKMNSPFEITQQLVRKIRLEDNEAILCHQSAWSREELQALLEEFGFTVISFDKNSIIQNFSSIPGISSMKYESTFVWAKKS